MAEQTNVYRESFSGKKLATVSKIATVLAGNFETDLIQSVSSQEIARN
jgi:hypothetical protein